MVNNTISSVEESPHLARPGTPGRDQSGRKPHYPELLAPAGDWDCAKAAVENGADAIYFGLEKFNARMRAHNFTVADLPRLMEFLHRRGVKGYVTFNTLVFENEMADAEQYLRSVIAAGVDAAIVQDVGIARLIRSLSTDFPIHASTQMTITSAAGVEFARDLGCNLVVLARECSIADIEKIQHHAESSNAGHGVGDFTLQDGKHMEIGEPARPASRHPLLPIEVFVHGALCVAYSGQCLTSESLGGRSANRGECAQACRMPYDLISDGKQVSLGDKRYLLSPQDLAGLDVLPEIIQAGVVSLKIEGRLKTPEYVANITRIYRSALDELSTANAETLSSAPSTRTSEIENRRYELEMAFSRGLYTGWFGGNNNQALVHARFGKKRGVFLGEITRIKDGKVALNLAGPLKPGDGVVFDAGAPDQQEEGGFVYQVDTHGKETWIGFGQGDIDFRRVHVGNKLWKTSDPELDRRLRRSFDGDAPKFRRPVELEIHGVVGAPLILIASDSEGHVAKIESTMQLVKAERQPLTTERLRDQLGRLGGTPFVLGLLKNELSCELMLPVSELNRLRREMVSQLERLRATPKRWMMSGSGAGVLNLAGHAHSFAPDTKAQIQDPTLIVLVRNLAQLEAALKCGCKTIYCDFENPKKYREAVTLFHTARGCESTTGKPAGDVDAQEATRPSIWVAPPRIFKMGEEWILNQVRSCNADGYLVRNYDHLKFFANDRRIGDFSLNIANRLAAEYFKNRFGLERITASYDLNVNQLDALLQSAPPEWFEITIHQHMPMFHMEHCVFCAFLSSGKDYRDCGRPCDVHDVRLRDRVGMEHPLKADIGCRNTVFNAQAQTGAEFVERLLSLGVRHFRVEFVNETTEQVEQTISKYRQLLRGDISGTQLWRELKLSNQLGVTRGQMGKA